MSSALKLKETHFEFFFGANPAMPGHALLEVRDGKTQALVMKQVFTAAQWNDVDKSMRECLKPPDNKTPRLTITGQN